jgi:DNA-binding XRE family transcriptional regulator
VVLFLKPAIERYTVPAGESGKPQASIKINIAAWDTFKKMIYEIYDHRI